MDKREQKLRLGIALAINPEVKQRLERELAAYLTGEEAPAPEPASQPVGKASRWWWAGGLAVVIGLGTWAMQPAEAPWRTEYLQQRLDNPTASTSTPTLEDCSVSGNGKTQVCVKDGKITKLLKSQGHGTSWETLESTK